MDLSRLIKATTLMLVLLIASNAAIADEMPSPPPINPSLRMVLPSEIHAVAGIETNFYFDNVVLVLNPANFAFDVTCTKGSQQSERWTWVPTDEDVGELPFQLEVRDEHNRVVSRGSSTIKIAAAKAEKKKPLSLLMVGDSLTHASIYPQYLLNLSQKSSNLELTLAGSHVQNPQNTANRHEGYGGWTAKRFVTYFDDTARQEVHAKRGSPFLYKQPDGSIKLDFPHYCQDVNEGRFPDAVTIFLGPNDIFSFQDDTIAGGIEDMLGHYDKLIEMVHTASPSTRIGVMLPVPPAASQDAFGSNYSSGQTRWQYKRNQHALVDEMVKRYAGRRSDGVHLIATHVNLDCVHNYPTASVAPNAHAEEKIVRQTNGVHPSAAGYRQIGDSVYAWLVSP